VNSAVWRVAKQPSVRDCYNQSPVGMVICMSVHELTVQVI